MIESFSPIDALGKQFEKIIKDVINNGEKKEKTK